MQESQNKTQKRIMFKSLAYTSPMTINIAKTVFEPIENRG